MKKYKSTIPSFELKRVKSDILKAKISSSKDAAEYARQFYHADISIYESFFMITLNNANNTTGYVKISQGGITGTVVDVRIIMKYAIENLATAIIIYHNHPSGTLKPSHPDIKLTESIKLATSFMNIKLLDHVILTEDSYFSFADESLL